MATLREHIRTVLRENDPWERSVTSHPVLGDESVRTFVARHGLKIRDGMIVLYHATPRKTKLMGDVIRAGSYLASSPEKAIHFAGRDRGLSVKDIICYEVPILPSELEWVGHYQTNADIPLSRTINIKNISEAKSIGNKTIVCVDIQPEYASYFTFDLKAWCNFLNRASKNNHLLLLYNGEQLGMVSEHDYRDWLFTNGVKEDLAYSVRMIDKGYAFFRYCMDSGIDEDATVDLVKFMRSNSINDSRDIDKEMWDAFIQQYPHHDVRELLENADDLVSIPDLMDDLSSLSNIMLTGGGINECLKEVEIALKALGKPYTTIEEFTY